MTIANQDLGIDEGATRTLVIPLTVNGAPYVVPDGAIIKWWASPSRFDDPNTVPSKKVTGTNLLVSTVDGQSSVQITMYPGDTVGYGQKKLWHEAWITLLDGITVPLFSGTMTVHKRLVV